MRSQQSSAALPPSTSCCTPAGLPNLPCRPPSHLLAPCKPDSCRPDAQPKLLDARLPLLDGPRELGACKRGRPGMSISLCHAPKQLFPQHDLAAQMPPQRPPTATAAGCMIRTPPPSRPEARMHTPPPLRPAPLPCRPARASCIHRRVQSPLPPTDLHHHRPVLARIHGARDNQPCAPRGQLHQRLQGSSAGSRRSRKHAGQAQRQHKMLAQPQARESGTAAPTTHCKHSSSKHVLAQQEHT